MPLVYQQNINAESKLAVWHITEEADFFLKEVPLQKEISHPHKRLQHLAGRYLLKELYPSFPLELILIADTRKPYLATEAFHFSISHCGDYAAALVSKTHRVGVDIETVREKIGSIVPKFMSPAELTILPIAGNDKLATLCWSIKESIYKWQGNLGVDFKRDIKIEKILGDEMAGEIHCIYQSKMPLSLHYLYFNNQYLAWLLTNH